MRAFRHLPKIKVLVSLLFLAGCAGTQRSCAVYQAENYGSDWLIVQVDYQGHPFNCWKLQNSSVTNEAKSDGIYWVGADGHLVHIGGWYNRVQVSAGNFAAAGRSIGVDSDRCGNGRYPEGAPQ